MSSGFGIVAAPFGGGFSHKIAELDVAHHDIIRIDQVAHAGHNTFAITGRVRRGELGGVDFAQQTFAHTTRQIPASVLECELGRIEQLQSKVFLYVGGSDDDDTRNARTALDTLSYAHLFHVLPHFLANTNGTAGLTGSQPVVHEQRIVGGLQRQEIADKELMGQELEPDVAQLFCSGFDVSYGSIVPGLVEFLFARDFLTKVCVAQKRIQGIKYACFFRFLFGS